MVPLPGCRDNSDRIVGHTRGEVFDKEPKARGYVLLRAAMHSRVSDVDYKYMEGRWPVRALNTYDEVLRRDGDGGKGVWWYFLQSCAMVGQRPLC